VIVEPDAVPHEVDGCGRNAAGTDRPALLAETVGRLKDSGPVQVYLDAGNPGFVSDTEQVANALRRSGVAKADGFSLNVANFRTTDENVGYGTEISTALGGAHFVIDTSRNGKGPLEGDTGDGPSFCNPPGRALGTADRAHRARPGGRLPVDQTPRRVGRGLPGRRAGRRQVVAGVRAGPCRPHPVISSGIRTDR